ncbi:hypothetical protein [Nocardia sp. NPDC004123]
MPHAATQVDSLIDSFGAKQGLWAARLQHRVRAEFVNVRPQTGEGEPCAEANRLGAALTRALTP